MALSFIVGIPRGRFFPFAFGMNARLSGSSVLLYVGHYSPWPLTPECPRFPCPRPVFLPWFSVTRFTAIARPYNEWVRSHCKAFSPCPSALLTAFAIRVCSLLTVDVLWPNRYCANSHPPSQASAHYGRHLLFLRSERFPALLQGIYTIAPVPVYRIARLGATSCLLPRTAPGS